MEKKRCCNRICRKSAACLLVFALLGSAGLTGCQDEKTIENQQAYRKVGINKMNQGDYAGAVESFQKALDLSKADVRNLELDICYYKATAQYNSGDTKGALETCQALINFEEKDAKAYFIRGCIYLKEGEQEKAKTDYEKALGYCGKNYSLYLSAYENLAGAGFTQEAEELIAKALKLEGDKPEDYRERGHIYLIRGEYEKARKELDKAINGGDDKALLYLAQVYEAQGQEKKAAPMYENYLKKNGSDASTLVLMGEAQLKSGEYQKALELFQQALKAKDPGTEKQLRRNEIICYENLLDFATAKEKMVSYLKDYPEDEEAQRENIFLQTR